jgi:zinc transporter, ZIP family
MNTFYGLLIPFLGTVLGAACVFFMKKGLGLAVRKLLLGFASGVMVAASVWSLIIPAVAESGALGKLAFVPAAVGVAAGMAFLLVLDGIIPHLHMDTSAPEGPRSSLKRTTMLCLAVTLHNIPEGMAVGVVFAGLLSGKADISTAGAFALSVGIAIQNFPEGAIISMPLAGDGNGKLKSFIYGTLSGIVEPVAALGTILLTGIIVPLLPYLLSFAAGAMLYVVVEELIPEASEGGHSNNGTIGFGTGFILMMTLDIALG